LSDDQIARLKKELADLLRLRGELDAKNRELAALGETLEQRRMKITQSEQLDAPTRFVVTQKATAQPARQSHFRTSMKTGNAVVTGGWQTSSGKRIFVVIQPEIIHDENGKKVILIAPKSFEIPELQVAGFNLGSLSTQITNLDQHGMVVTDAGLKNIVDSLAISADTKPQNMSRMTVLPGQPARISSDGPEGIITIEANASPSSDSQELNLEFGVSISRTNDE